MILLMVDDLLFSTQIREVALARGREITKDPKATYNLAIIDLNAKKFDPFEAISQVKKGVEVITFFSHVDAHLAQRAKEMHVSQVLPRSKFVTLLPIILQSEV